MIEAAAGPTYDPTPAVDIDLDVRVGRRLTGAEEWWWYLFAGVTYIATGIWHKWLLNWLIGPAWLVSVIVIGPWLVDGLRLVIGRPRS